MTTRYDLCFIDIDIDEIAPVGTPSWFGWITRLSDADEGYYCPLSLKGEETRPSANSKRELLQHLYSTARDLRFKFGGLRDHAGNAGDAVVRVIDFGDEGVKT